jgi:hypothetical protein
MLWGRRALDAGALAGFLLATLTLCCLPEGAAASPRFLYYVKGNAVHRLSLPDMGSQTLLELPQGEAPAGPKWIKASAGKVVWARMEGTATSLVSWDGSEKNPLPVEKHNSKGPESFRVEYDGEGRVSRLVPGGRDTYLSEFLLSPDGTQVVWNVNLTTGLSPENAGTSHQRHLVYRAGIDGKNRRRILEQEYDVTGILADATESRHLLGWSRPYPEWLYFTRFEGAQLGSRHVGLYRCNVRTGALETVDESIEQVLALSEDEKLAAHTPNDDSCCGGVNQTNNRVGVKNLETGEETVVFDEWGEFANEVREPGDDEPSEEIMPVGAYFSPDGGRLAITLHRWSSASDPLSRSMTTVRKIEPGARGSYQEGRCVLGWQDDRHVVLGECGAPDHDTRIVRSAFLFDVEEETESPLPVEDISLISIGR